MARVSSFWTRALLSVSILIVLSGLQLQSLFLDLKPYALSDQAPHTMLSSPSETVDVINTSSSSSFSTSNNEVIVQTTKTHAGNATIKAPSEVTPGTLSNAAREEPSSRTVDTRQNSTGPIQRVYDDRLWRELAENLSRPYHSLQNYDWCIPMHSDQHNQSTNKHQFNGIQYIKLPKSASSTGAGVALRIAQNLGARLHGTPCVLHWRHGFAYNKNHGPTRVYGPRWLFTFVRDPIRRALSGYAHFRIARAGHDPSDEGFITWLNVSRNGQVDYLAFHRVNIVSVDAATSDTMESLIEMVRDEIIHYYHFVGVAERMDESLVAMKILYHLDMTDILVLSSKTAGGYDDGQANRKCYLIPKLNLTRAVDDYIDSKVHTINNADYLVYRAANRSLDKTIEAIGHDFFQRELQSFRRLQKQAEDECLSKAVFPCSPEGVRQIEASEKNCYDLDSGCGYPCLDQLFPNSTLARQNPDMQFPSIIPKDKN